MKNREKHSIRWLIDTICDEIGPRPAGSPSEAAAARFLEKTLSDWGIEAKTESFSVASRALQAFIAFVCGSFPVAYLLYFVHPAISLTILTVVMIVIAAHRALELDIPAMLLPKSWSTNVVGKIPAKGERRNILIFAGHHDSAYRMPFLAAPRLYGILGKVVMATFLAMIVFLGLAAWKTFFGPSSGYGLMETIVLIPCGFGAVFSTVIPFGIIRRDAVPGANDNLSAVAVAWEIGRRVAQKPLEHTEIWVVSFGSEEPGLKGSQAFADQHRAELWSSHLINIESCAQSGDLYIIDGETLSFARHAEKTMRLLEESAVTGGIRIERRTLSHGLTDATSFSKRWLEATCVIRLNRQGFLDHYHNPGDDPASVSEEQLQETLRLCMGAMEQLEEES